MPSGCYGNQHGDRLGQADNVGLAATRFAIPKFEHWPVGNSVLDERHQEFPEWTAF